MFGASFPASFVSAKTVADMGASVPFVPIKVTAGGMLSNEVNINWTPAYLYNSDGNTLAPVDTYVVYRADGATGSFDGVQPLTTLFANSLYPSFSDHNVLPNTTYRYTVAGRYQGSEGLNSNVVVATTPQGPFTIQTEVLGASKIKLSWNNVTANATSYNVYRSTLTGNEQLVGSTMDLTYTDTGLTASSQYIYHVKPVTAMGEDYGAVTNVVMTLATDTVVSSPVVSSTAPVATTPALFAIQTEVLGSSRVKLSWNNVTANATSYNVYRSTLTGNEQLVGSTMALTYTDIGLMASSQYVYHVRPVTPIGEDYGAVTNLVTTLASDRVTTPSSAPVLQANISSPTTNYLSWSLVTDASSYNLYRSSLGINTLISTTTNLSYLDTGVMSGYEYVYFVKARNEFGEGLSSNAVTLKTATPSAPVVTGLATGRNEITLSWPAVNSAQVYNVYRSSDSRLFILAGTVSGTSFTDKNLGYNQGYYYYVKAKAGTSPSWSQADEGRESATVLVRTLDQNARVERPVLMGKALTPSIAQLSWAPVAIATHYRLTRDYVEYKDPSIGYFPASGVIVTGTSYLDAAAYPLARYTYSLTAIDSDDSVSFASAPVTVEMVAPTVPTAPAPTFPKPVVPPVAASHIVIRAPFLAGDTVVYVKRGKPVRFTYAYTNTTAATQLTRIVRQLVTPAGKVVQSNGVGVKQTFGARRALLFSPAPLSTGNLVPGVYRVSIKIYSTKKGDNGKLLDENSFSIQVER
jgi:fibronectin type 3 domain-containing protein